MPPKDCVVTLRRRTGQVRLADNVPCITDPIGLTRVPAKSVKILHAAVLRPQEWVKSQVTSQIRRTNDMAPIVHRPGSTESTTQRTHVRHDSVLPEERVSRGQPGHWVGGRVGIRLAGDFAGVVNEESESVQTTQSPQVLHRTVLPQKGSRLCGEKARASQ